MSDPNDTPQEQKEEQVEAALPVYQTPGYVAKPEGVTWGDHVGPAKLRHRHHLVVHLAALGHTQKEIAAKTGFSQPWLSTLLSNTEMQEAIARERYALYSMDPDQALKLALPKAVKAITEVLDNPQARDSLKVDVAFRLMERTHGRAKQQIEVSGGLIKDLFAQLDKAKTIDVSSKVDEAEWTDVKKSKEEEKAHKAPMDEWLEKLTEQK